MLSFTLLVSLILFSIAGVDAIQLACGREGGCGGILRALIGVAIGAPCVIYPLWKCYKNNRKSTSKSNPEITSESKPEITNESKPKSTNESKPKSTSNTFTYFLPKYTAKQKNRSTSAGNIIDPVQYPHVLEEVVVSKSVLDITEDKYTKEQIQDDDEIKEFIIQVPDATEKRNSQDERPTKKPIMFFNL